MIALIVVLVVGLWIARPLAGALQGQLGFVSESETVQRGAAYLVLVVLALVASAVLGWLLGKVVGLLPLGELLNRIVGAVSGQKTGGGAGIDRRGGLGHSGDRPRQCGRLHRRFGAGRFPAGPLQHDNCQAGLGSLAPLHPAVAMRLRRRGPAGTPCASGSNWAKGWNGYRWPPCWLWKTPRTAGSPQAICGRRPKRSATGLAPALAAQGSPVEPRLAAARATTQAQLGDHPSCALVTTVTYPCQQGRGAIGPRRIFSPRPPGEGLGVRGAARNDKVGTRERCQGWRTPVVIPDLIRNPPGAGVSGFPLSRE